MPDDRYHAIYFAMLLAGVGFLLPYNSFITDVDYLHHKYPGGSLGHPHSPQRHLSTLSLGGGLLGIPRHGTLSGDVAWRGQLMWFSETQQITTSHWVEYLWCDLYLGERSSYFFRCYLTNSH